jgi:CDP-paratose 2-epimerase
MSGPARPHLRAARSRVLITGGCGFLGCNLAAALAARGQDVIVLDNFARAGAAENAEWLRSRDRRRIGIEVADVRDQDALRWLIPQASAVLHLASQVAVTTSLEHPLDDFDINARGTLNVLESVRRLNPSVAIVFASTNKVYGKLLAATEVLRVGDRYAPRDERLLAGIAEDAPLDLYSPYGCSKGAADQYVHDYARVFGLRTVVLRMSCIYGPRQFGTEDQGWIAHFLLQAIRGDEITIYGDGYQVRDALYVDDAVAAWIEAYRRVDRVRGCVFNLGGGYANAVSLREMMNLIEKLRGVRPTIRFAAPRPGDQVWYVSDVRRISAALDWFPRVAIAEGMFALERWLSGRFAAASVHRIAEAQA